MVDAIFLMQLFLCLICVCRLLGRLQIRTVTNRNIYWQLLVETKDQNWGCCSEISSPWTALLHRTEFGPELFWKNEVPELSNPSLCPFSVSSDQRLHSRCNKRGRGARIHNPCWCQQTVQAEEQSLPAHRGEWELARTNKDPAGVWGETRRWRLPFHGTHALWGGQVRLCPSF